MLEEDGEVVVICSITKRVTLSSILQHSRVEGIEAPEAEVVSATRKVQECPHPRTRIWE